MLRLKLFIEHKSRRPDVIQKEPKEDFFPSGSRDTMGALKKGVKLLFIQSSLKEKGQNEKLL